VQLTWLLAHKVLLPGHTTLERFVARLRNRVENRLWKLLGRGITDEQRTRLEELLTVPPQGRSSWLDKLRSGPVRISGPALVNAIHRLQTVRDLSIKLSATGVPTSRLASLARFAGTAKATAIGRLPPIRRLATLLQLNYGEGRHSLARDVFHGKRGELRQCYREGQEDQLGALGLVINIIVLWNTIYIDAVLAQLRQEGYPVRDEDVARLSPFIHKHHINLLGRYSFAVSEAVKRGELRALRNPDAPDA